MCNGWNHPSWCNCGWGGVWYPPSSKGGFDRFFRGDIYQSYINTNARCPVCGCPVFFYQSPHGGRVFFDSLGPPWPKHPCTDRGQHGEFTGKVKYEYLQIHESPVWAKLGWRPIYILELGNNRSMYHVTFAEAKIGGKIFSSFAYGAPINNLKRKDLLLFYKSIDKQTFEIWWYDITTREEGKELLNYC